MLSESSKPHWLAPDDFLRGVPWAATETDRQPVGEITQGKLGAKIPYPRLLPGDSRVAVDTYEASQTAAGVRLELDADGGRVELGFDCDPSRVDLRKEAAGVEVEVWFGGSKIDSRPLLLAALFDVLDDVADGLKLFSVFVRDFDSKFFFESHHELDGVE